MKNQKSKIHPVKSARGGAKQFDRVKNKKSSGVTLFELIIVLAVFMFVLGAVFTIFISIIESQRGILQEQEFLNQMSYATEYISRMIKLAQKDATGSCLGSLKKGYYYVLTHYDAVTGFHNGIKFLRNDKICQEFFLDTDKILKEIKNISASQNILSQKFTLKYVRFIINGDKALSGASENDSVQPRVTMAIDALFQFSSSQQERIIQTTVSQKNLNSQ